MARTFPYFPRLSAFDPAEASEGSLDPLGLAQLAGQLADELVPGYTERSRRPRFLVALALGSRILGRPEYEEGVYGEYPDGPANIAFERLLVESYARTAAADDDGLRGVPGIGKARDAAERDARLSSRLHLVAPRAVGLWVAYKGLARKLRILDDDGNLDENGHALLAAWEAGIDKRGIATGSGNETVRFLEDADRALGPLLDTSATTQKPRSMWRFLYENLHPDRMTRAEAVVLRRLLVEGDERRKCAFESISQTWSDPDELKDLQEDVVLTAMLEKGDEVTRRQVQAIFAYERVVVLLTRAFDAMRYVASKRPDGAVSVDAVLASSEVGPAFRETAADLRTAVPRAEDLVQEVGEPDSVAHSLAWLHEGSMEGAGPLFDQLISRHYTIQRGKSTDGKRPWFEGGPGGWHVRRRYIEEKPPETHVTYHPYRTSPLRQTLDDLWNAER